MECNTTTQETLGFRHAHINVTAKEEEKHVWNSLIRIEQLKRNKQKKKNALLRRSIQCDKIVQ